MIQFVIYEDNQDYIDRITDIINRVMFQNDEVYQIFYFDKFDQELSHIIDNNNKYKIYILDIDCSTSDTFAIAKKIRQKDFESVIVFLTYYSEKWCREVLEGKYLFLSFIDKSVGLDTLFSDISSFLEKKEHKKILQWQSHNIIYRISIDEILYIVSEKMNHYITVVTENNKFSITGTLIDIKKQLDDRFIYSHRSCLVNIERISVLNRKTREITFDNGQKIDLLSFRSSKTINDKLKNLL